MGKIITITDRLDLALLELGAVFVDLVADGLLTDVEIFRKGLVRIPVQCHQTAKQCFIHAVTLFPDPFFYFAEDKPNEARKLLLRFLAL